MSDALGPRPVREAYGPNGHIDYEYDLAQWYERTLSQACELLEQATHRMGMLDRGSTHWEGCESGHTDCRLRADARAFLAQVRK